MAKVDLRPHQREALTNLLLFLENEKELLVIHPTGSGKSILISELANEVIKAYPLGSVLVLVPFTKLQLQQINTCNNFGDLKASSLNSKNLSSARIFITTVQATQFDKAKYELKRAIHNDIKLIIIDESHIGDNWFHHVKELYPDAMIVHFTATPYKGNLYAFPGVKIAHAVSLQEMIDAGYLVEPKLIEIVQHTKYTPEVIANSIRIYKKHELGKRSVWFFTTKEQAREARNACIVEGLRAEFIISDHSLEHREEILEKFEKGELDILTNCGCLSTGFDCPPIESVFMPLGTNSVVTYLQRIGRALRKSPGKTEARIYVFGEAPSIKRGVYRKYLVDALNAKSNLTHGKDTQDLYSLLDFMQHDSTVKKEKIEWTKKTVEICERLKQGGNESVSDLIRYRRFPEKYLAGVQEFEKHMNTPKPGSEPITGMQQTMLARKGFQPEDLAEMKKSEAQVLIAGIQSYETRHGEFRVPEGRYKDRHIKEVPGAYFKWLKDKKMFTNPLWKIRKKWKEQEAKK